MWNRINESILCSEEEWLFPVRTLILSDLKNNIEEIADVLLYYKDVSGGPDRPKSNENR